jgi:hypothetical protein
MSIRRNGFALLVTLALLITPATFAAEQASSDGLWQAFTNWLMVSLGLGDELSNPASPVGQPLVPEAHLEASDLILPGG